MRSGRQTCPGGQTCSGGLRLERKTAGQPLSEPGTYRDPVSSGTQVPQQSITCFARRQRIHPAPHSLSPRALASPTRPVTRLACSPRHPFNRPVVCHSNLPVTRLALPACRLAFLVARLAYPVKLPRPLTLSTRW
jgi:hypothetical protein